MNVWLVILAALTLAIAPAAALGSYEVVKETYADPFQ